MDSIFDEILSNIHGLEPQAALVLGSGFVREEWKSLCFKRGYSITGPAIQSSRSIAALFVPESNGRIIEAQARIELLRQLFSKEEIRNALPILSRNRNRPRYFDQLDRTLQQGRMNFAHRDESEVIAHQLAEKTGHLQKREEYFLLNRFWEHTLQLKNLWDEARLYESAVLQLGNGVRIPFSKLFRVEHIREKPRVEWFWNELSRHIEIKKVSSSELLSERYSYRHLKSEGIHFIRKKAHSLEDAANFLIDHLSVDLDHRIVVIQDLPVIRRTLTRVASQRGIPLFDPRDPTLVTLSEAIKLALLEFEICAKNFSRTPVLEWLSAFHPGSGKARKKIIDTAVVQGLDSFERVPEIHASLKRLSDRYSSRMDLPRLEKSLLESIRENGLPHWTAKVIQKTIQEWKSSLEQVDLKNVKKPIRFWFEQLKERLKQVNPVVDPTKNRHGLRLYRVDQCPSFLLDPEKTEVHFFGLNTAFFDAKDIQGEWFSIRDQEILSMEYGWMSSSEKSDQNLHSFQLWNLRTGSSFWEFEYDENGSETEGFDFAFSDVERYPLEKRGAHTRLFHSWKGASPISSELPPLPIEQKDPSKGESWPFSFLNHYGNCPFIAYSQHLLKLQDERDVDVELAADRFGTLLHAALEEVVKNPSNPETAFELAWKKTPPTGWERNERWYRATRNQILNILNVFVTDEVTYREQSQTSLFESEKEVEVVLSGIPLKGRIDRIDQHEDGLVVMDYKTSSTISDGLKTLEKGKDLQLGLYALAVRALFHQEVITAQYVRLDEAKVNRNAGFLFSGWNKGKKADAVEKPVSTARAGTNSLFMDEPPRIWEQLQAKVDGLSASLRAGNFSPNPADPLDCAQCRYRDVCGESRR